MVRRVREDLKIHKHTLNLYAGDYAKIQELFPDIGAGVVIRKVIRNYVESIEAKTAVEVPAATQLEIKFND
jgi:hypothetical protein